MKVNICGAGLAGCVAAAYFKTKGYSVQVFETRSHIGGNCYDSILNNVRVHNYGPHIFHTSDEKVWKFMNTFTNFNGYKLRIKGRLSNGQIIPVPYNKLSEIITGKKSDKWILNNVFKYYTEKQWGRKFSKVPRSVTNRLSLRRDSFNANYFQDTYEGIPEAGYTAMFQTMLDGCNVMLGVNARDFLKASADIQIYTGSLDALCDYYYGQLEYRSLEFNHSTCSPPEHKWINECNNHVRWIRSYDQSQWYTNDEIERKEMKRTIVTQEFSYPFDGKNIPMYPINDNNNFHRQLAYKTFVASRMPNIVCVGRLAWYRYVNMDQVVRGVLDTLQNL